jgi:hypothetical protein
MHAFISHYTIPLNVSVPPSATVQYHNRSTLGDLVDGAIVIEVNVQPFRLEVHGLHVVGLEDAVLLG